MRTRREFIGQALSFGLAFPLLLTDRPVFAANGKRWAVLVGVAKYAPVPERSGDPTWRTDADDLHGPDNDVPAMRDLLLGKYGFEAANIRLLQNEHATRQVILDSWNWLRDNAAPGDQVVFYYSGHGTRVKRPEGDPVAGPYTSALCPHDARRNGVLPGYEIGRAIDALRTDVVTVIVDACSSGSASRSPFTHPRVMHLQKKDGFDDPFAGAATGAAGTTEFAGGSTGKPQRERYLGASRIGQPAVDAALLPDTYENPNMGAMTFFLLEELRADTANRLTYSALCDRVRRRMVEKFQDDASDPQISGPNLTSEAFLALPDRTPVAFQPVAAEAVTVSGANINLRSVAGAVILPGSLLEARVSAQARAWQEDLPDPERALVRIRSVVNGQAYGTLLRGEPAVGQRYVEILRGTHSDRPLVVYVAGKAAEIAKASAKEVDNTRLVEKPEGADVALIADSETGVAVYRGVTPLTTIEMSKIPALLRRLAAVHSLIGLQNRLEGLTLDVTGGGKSTFADRRIGAKMPYQISSSKDGYITLLALAADGKITGGADIPIRKNRPLRIDATVTPPTGVDILKVLFTDRPTGVSIPATGKDFEDRGGDAKAIAEEILAKFQGGVNTASARGQDFAALAGNGGGIAVDGWASAEFYLRILPEA